MAIDADIGILRKFLPLPDREIIRIYTDQHQNRTRDLTSNKPVDFDVDPEHNTDPGIFVGIFTTAP